MSNAKALESILVEAVAVVQNGAVPMERAQAVQIVHNLSVDGLLAPAPQIIRTPAELEALDPDTVIQPPLTEFSEWPRTMTPEVMRYYISTFEGSWFPAVKVAEGAHLRACREALEGADRDRPRP
ncbi:hypothetical protein [Corynebacterium sp.]|uniref:hypothetical protein n=1 Tax=Corynebacterium sp. TaxID=1720 RepID=UPI003B3B30C2